MSRNKNPVEEEDLDDLDDVLEQFTVKPPTAPHPKTNTIPSSSSSVPSQSVPPDPENGLSDDFAKHLAAEMEAMLQKLSGESAETEPSTASGTSGTAGSGHDAAFREIWEKMLIKDLEDGEKGKGLETFLGQGEDTEEDVDAKAYGIPSSSGKEKSATEEEEDPFQRAIQQAMEKLQSSDTTLKTDSKDSVDGLEGLLSSLGNLNVGEDGEGGENLESMLETMMSQLMSKEILYEPLKELDTKYPDYLSQNSSTLSPEDLSRYTSQRECVSQIVSVFENPSYSDENSVQSAEILRLMNEMQSYGSPPSEIMGPMPPGFELGTDGLPKLPEGCIIS